MIRSISRRLGALEKKVRDDLTPAMSAILISPAGKNDDEITGATINGRTVQRLPDEALDAVIDRARDMADVAKGAVSLVFCLYGGKAP